MKLSWVNLSLNYLTPPTTWDYFSPIFIFYLIYFSSIIDGQNQALPCISHYTLKYCFFWKVHTCVLGSHNHDISCIQITIVVAIKLNKLNSIQMLHSLQPSRFPSDTTQNLSAQRIPQNSKDFPTRNYNFVVPFMVFDS